MNSKVFIAVILIPCYSIIIKRGRKHVHISITIHIGCINRKSTIGRCCNSMNNKVFIAVILIPCYLITHVRGREHVYISVSIHINCKDGYNTNTVCIGINNLGWQYATDVIRVWLTGIYFTVAIGIFCTIHQSISITVRSPWVCCRRRVAVRCPAGICSGVRYLRSTFACTTQFRQISSKFQAVIQPVTIAVSINRIS